jgi:DNA-binding NarL/FixJ family response regulator
MFNQQDELENLEKLQAQFLDAEKVVAERLAARNHAIKALVDSGVTKYRIAKVLGVTQTTIANAVANSEK